MEVGARTMSKPCPSCNKSLLIEDIVVKRYSGLINIETCGKLIVGKLGQAVAKNRIVALGGIEVEGRLDCKHALCAGKVKIGKKAEWKGDLYAVSLEVESGAVIQESRFKIPDDPLAEFRHQEEEQEEDE